MADDARVLIADDDAAIGTVLCDLLAQAGYVARHVASGEAALLALQREPFDALIADVRMPGMDGLTLLQRVAARSPELPVLMLTAHGSVPLAVEAMKHGAADFMLKPFDREELLFALHKALLGSKQQRARAPQASASGGLIGQSEALRETHELIRKTAQSHATVLIRGETGTGKELVARAIHGQGARRDKPFVAVNCGALPETLLESELFGHEKGAFTGAARRKPGRVELAHEGTLFLDEIGDVSPAVQVKLLRVLQERTFERVGGTASVSADVRFIAATHRDLNALVAAGGFRADLFYRLSVVPIWLPPLRARGEDIDRLVLHFCALHAAAHGRPAISLRPRALERLRAEPWPGNVRQLQNLIERLVVLNDDPSIDLPELERELARDAPGGQAASGGELDEHRRRAEGEALREALRRSGDNRSLAARLLGISRRTLYTKLAEHGIA
ncbi:MAG TPA: sigma-54 dependent transcriptional regulator [Polyangiales bacterium]|nr:sigma-54 dependent transcriptional regulator [Polyangiales bacterium]